MPTHEGGKHRIEQNCHQFKFLGSLEEESRRPLRTVRDTYEGLHYKKKKDEKETLELTTRYDTYPNMELMNIGVEGNKY